MAREVTVDEGGLASGVAYIDKATARENHVRARIVVVAASACESARPAATRSRRSSRRASATRAASSASTYRFDRPRRRRLHPEDDGDAGAQRGRHRRHAPLHAVVAGQQDARFPRGYHIEISGGRRMPGCGFLGNIHNYTGLDASGTPIAFGGYGEKLKSDYRASTARTVNFAAAAKWCPTRTPTWTSTRAVVDKWASRCRASASSSATTRSSRRSNMQETFRAIIKEMGGTPLSSMPGADTNYDLAAGGRIIHEVGVTRMGKRSVDVGAEQVLPGARREERLRRRRRPVRLAGRQELHVDHPRAVDAHGHIHR
jgi:hypothetical protein